MLPTHYEKSSNDLIGRSIQPSYNYKGISLKDLGLTAVFNCMLAGFLTFLLRDGTYWNYLIITQCIGLSICFFCESGLWLFKPQSPWRMTLTVAAAILLGGSLGGLIGSLLAGIELATFVEQKIFTLRLIVLILVFGSIASFFFMAQDKISQTRQQLQEERIQRLNSEKLAVEAQLKMLQAQIEPHFLFNTLSNILSLLDTDAVKGKAMLRDLTSYLRAALTEARVGHTTLGSEMALIQAYLNIFKIRMGDRLQVQVEIDEALQAIPFSPMLIQPLVENAIKHGLDEEIHGGVIHIRAEREDDILRVCVADTGPGLKPGPAKGMGLANIRDRLEALYGGLGRLIITENQPTGIRAVIEVPYAEPL